MANLSNSPITQVSQVPTHTNLQPQLLTRLFLDLRGRRFEVDRETIMNLPESVLLCLFPNGLVLSRQSVALSDGGGDDDEEEVYGVDVRAALPFSSLRHPADYKPEVRPRMFPVCTNLLPKCFRQLLWYIHYPWSLRRAAAALRIPLVRIWTRVITKSFTFKAGHYSSPRRT